MIKWLIPISIVLAGCNVTVRDEYLVAASPRIEVLAAQTRRVQILTELEVLERQHRRTLRIEDRAVIQSQINRLRFELEELNAIIQR